MRAMDPPREADVGNVLGKMGPSVFENENGGSSVRLCARVARIATEVVYKQRSDLCIYSSERIIE